MHRKVISTAVQGVQETSQRLCQHFPLAQRVWKTTPRLWKANLVQKQSVHVFPMRHMPAAFLQNRNLHAWQPVRHTTPTQNPIHLEDKPFPPKELFDGKVVLSNSKIGPIIIGITNIEYPGVADAISKILVRSISDARQSNATPGHLPDHLVDYIIGNYISPEKVKLLWGPYGKRFVVTHQSKIIGSVLVASSSDTILYYNRSFNNVNASDYPNFKPNGYHQIMNLSVEPNLRKMGIGKILIDTIGKDFRAHFAGKGLWMRADPPWHDKLANLGFKHDPSMDSFLDPEVEKTLGLSHAEYNHQYDCRCCHPNPENPANLQVRSERLKKEKLQYLSFTFDFHDKNKLEKATYRNIKAEQPSSSILQANDLAIASSETILKFFQYKLDTAPNGFQFDKYKVLEVFKSSYCHSLVGKELGLYYSTLRTIIENLYLLSDAELIALKKAEQYARHHIQMETFCVIEEVAVPQISEKENHVEIRDSSDIEKFNVDEVAWHRINEYIVDRVGPVKIFIDSLNSSDEIIVSNFGIEEYLLELNMKKNNAKTILQLQRISLPVSSYEKELWLIRFNDDTRTLLFSKIKGKNYLLHYRLLLKRYLSQTNKNVHLQVMDSAVSLSLNNNTTLHAFFLQYGDKLQEVSSLVFGYTEVFRSDWVNYFEETVRDTKSQWQADFYCLPHAQEKHQRIVVLSTRLPMHGEILSEAFNQALHLVPHVRHIFIGGSAGSLSAQVPYEMVFPSLLQMPTNHQTICNILSAENHASSIHGCVPSPLVETPQFLAELRKQGITTIDMEAGYLAELHSKYPHLKIGLAVIPTDFPKHTETCKSISLFTKDVAKHSMARHAFPAAIYRYLVNRQAIYHLEFEKQLGSIKKLSAKNIQCERDKLGVLSPSEVALKIKIMRELQLSFSIRLSPTRLWQALGDKVFLSPKLINEFAERKATMVTPEIENQVFGAHQYIFGEIGIENGSDKYGTVVIKIKDNCWKNISWATKYSAWWAAARLERETGKSFISNANTITDQNDLTQVQNQFAQWVFEPAHYVEAIALMIISHLRGKPEAVFQQFVHASNEELVKLIKFYNFAKMEGKIHQSLELEDIEKVLLPKDASQELQQRLQQNNIPFEWIDNTSTITNRSGFFATRRTNLNMVKPSMPFSLCHSLGYQNIFSLGTMWMRPNPYNKTSLNQMRICRFFEYSYN